MEPITKAASDIVTTSAEFGATVFVLVVVLVLLVIVLVGAYLLIRYVIRETTAANDMLMKCLQALVPQIQALTEKVDACNAISLRVEEKVSACDTRLKKARAVHAQTREEAHA